VSEAAITLSDERTRLIVGIMMGKLPLGAAISLLMVPVLATAAIIVLRRVAKRGSEV
jgi:multiple sugar transport system permease protein